MKVLIQFHSLHLTKINSIFLYMTFWFILHLFLQYLLHQSVIINLLINYLSILLKPLQSKKHYETVVNPS